MRADLLYKFTNTFDVYTALYEQDPISGEMNITYVLAGTQKGLIATLGGSQVYLSTREGIPIKSRINNAVDRRGTPVFQASGDEYPMYITAASPQYDTWGTIVGWRHTLSREIPMTLKERFQSSVAGIG